MSWARAPAVNRTGGTRLPRQLRPTPRGRASARNRLHRNARGGIDDQDSVGLIDVTIDVGLGGKHRPPPRRSRSAQTGPLRSRRAAAGCPRSAPSPPRHRAVAALPALVRAIDGRRRPDAARDGARRHDLAAGDLAAGGACRLDRADGLGRLHRLRGCATTVVAGTVTSGPWVMTVCACATVAALAASARPNAVAGMTTLIAYSMCLKPSGRIARARISTP